jgi:PKD repeat protein
MKFPGLKTMAVPKVAFVAAALVGGLLVSSVGVNPASATPSKAKACTSCHGDGSVSGTVTAVPSTTSPAAGATYTVAIKAPDNPLNNGGGSGYWIANSTAAGATGTTTGVYGGPSSSTSLSATMTAPAASGVYYYVVWANTGMDDTDAVTNHALYSITVAAAPVVVTTTTTLAVTPSSPATAPASPTLTATVTGAGAAGTVEFFNGATSLGSPVAVSSGTVSKTLSGIAAGSYSYTAKFAPTNPASFTPSTSSAAAYLVTPAPAPKPIAGFTSSVSSGVAPLAVSFTDASTGAPTSWAWTFGNGTTSTLQNPAATYTAAGTYTVSLVASNASGSSAAVTKTITVTAPAPKPTAAFTASATTGVAPLAVSFTDASTGAPTSWAWTFGNGTTSTLQNPSATYTAAGTYTVSLVATNAVGSSTAVTKTITVTAPVVKPTSSFTASATSGVAPLQVSFTDTSAGVPTSWAWDLGNGSTSTLRNPAATYATAGTYTVTLVATNAAGAGAVASKTITVTAPPTSTTAHITGLSRTRGEEGDRVTITGTGFTGKGVVRFGSETARVRSWTATSIAVRVPDDVDGTVLVTVTPAGGIVSNGVAFRGSDDDDHGDDRGSHRSFTFMVALLRAMK